MCGRAGITLSPNEVLKQAKADGFPVFKAPPPYRVDKSKGTATATSKRKGIPVETFPVITTTPTGQLVFDTLAFGKGGDHSTWVNSVNARGERWHEVRSWKAAVDEGRLGLVCVTSFVVGITVRQSQDRLLYLPCLYGRTKPGKGWFIVLKTDAEKSELLAERARRAHQIGAPAQSPLFVDADRAKAWLACKPSRVPQLVCAMERSLGTNHLDLVAGVASTASKSKKRKPSASPAGTSEPSKRSPLAFFQHQHTTPPHNPHHRAPASTSSAAPSSLPLRAGVDRPPHNLFFQRTSPTTSTANSPTTAPAIGLPITPTSSSTASTASISTSTAALFRASPQSVGPEEEEAQAGLVQQRLQEMGCAAVDRDRILEALRQRQGSVAGAVGALLAQVFGT